MRKYILALTFVSFILNKTVSLAHGPEDGPWMMHWGYGVGWWIFPLVMMVVMIILFFLFFGRRGGKSSWCGFGEQKDTESPLDILKKRYAKGEISKEEFESIKKEL